MAKETIRNILLGTAVAACVLPFVAPHRYFDLYEPDESWLTKNPMPTTTSPIMAWFNSDGYGGSARKLGLEMPNPPSRKEAIAWNGFEMRSYLGVPNVGPIGESLQLELLQALRSPERSRGDPKLGRRTRSGSTCARTGNAARRGLPVCEVRQAGDGAGEPFFAVGDPGECEGRLVQSDMGESRLTPPGR
jgi:hypothetical protein